MKKNWGTNRNIYDVCCKTEGLFGVVVTPVLMLQSYLV